MRRRYPGMEVEDGIVWSATTGPWVWVRVLPLHYDGLTDAERVRHMRALEAALAAIAQGEAMMLVVSEPARVAPANGGAPAPEWPAYQAGVSQWVAAQQFTERATYIGVRMNRVGIGAVVAAFNQLLSMVKASRSSSRAVADRNSYRAQADELVARMNGAGLPCRPATATELARLISRPCWLDMDRAATQPAGVIEGRRFYRTHVVQPSDERYVTTLVAEDFNLGTFPARAWMLPLVEWGYQPDLVVRFTVVPADEEARILDAAHAAHVDQVENITGDGDTSDPRVSIGLAQKLATTRELAHEVRASGQPWVWPQVCAVVAAPTEEVLKERIGNVRDSFKKRGVKLLHPAADQYDLLLDQIPGTRWTVRDWARRWPVTLLAAGMPHGTTTLGMDEGPYLGHTTNLDRSPVYLDLMALSRLGITPTVTITGQPGSGKSATLKKLLYEARLRGAWCVVLDPANETDALLALPGLGRTQVFQLDRRYAGLLDAWVVHPDNPAEAAAMAVDLVMIMLPNVHGTPIEIALTALADQVGKAPAPSMRAFVAGMLASNDPQLVAVGRALDTYSRLELAALFFGEYTEQRLEIGGSLTVLRWSGLDLAEPGTEASDLTSRNRLSSAVLHGTGVLVARLMEHQDRNHEKVLAIDEAHQFTGSPAGRALVRRYSAMARKHNILVTLVSQNAAHLHGGDATLLNNVSVALAFRSTDSGEQAAVGRLLRRGHLDRDGVWHSDPAIMARVGALGHRPGAKEVLPGYCLMRDPYNRVGEVLVDHPDQELWQAVQTTPMGAQARVVVGD